MQPNEKPPESRASSSPVWKTAVKILLRIALGVVIAVLLLVGLCFAIAYRG